MVKIFQLIKQVDFISTLILTIFVLSLFTTGAKPGLSQELDKQTTKVIEDSAGNTDRRMKKGGFGKPKWRPTTRYVPSKAAEKNDDEIIHCDPPFDKITVYVSFKTMPVKYNYSKDIKQLNDMVIASYEPYLAEDEQGNKIKKSLYVEHQTEVHKKAGKPLGMTGSRLEGIFRPKSLISGRKHYGCYFLDSIQYDVLHNLTVYMARDILNNPCIREKVKEHELLHVKAYQELAKKYEPKLRKALQDYADKYKAKRLRVNEYAAEGEKITKDLKAVITPILKALQTEQDKLHILIDSKGEYAVLPHICSNQR